MFGKIISIKDKKIEIELTEDIDTSKITRMADGKSPLVEMNILDGRHITADQRKKIYALINDFCAYTGYVPDEAKSYFKSMTQGIFNIAPFSLSNCSETVASYMITTILKFMFEEDIPFRTKIWDSLPDDFPRVAMCIRYRRCAICLAEHADIDHYKSIGMGRNRDKISHEGMYIEPLCRVHHTIRHTIGIKAFVEKYHLKPIKVTPELARELKLGTYRTEVKQ